MATRVEILSFEGCPNAAPTQALVERIARELGLEPDLELVDVPDAQAAERLRFVGSPSVRVDGVDIEPGAAEREQHAYACRVYRTEAGPAGRPDEAWVRDALQRATEAGG